MKNKAPYHFIILWIAVMGYAPSVWAAELILGPMEIPLIKYLYVCWMASWGSFAAFLQKYAEGSIASKWRIIAARDIVNANLAAILTFWLCRYYAVPTALEAIFFTLSGYGGARIMEAAYKKWVAVGDHAISKATGAPMVTQDDNITITATPENE
jgi:hypothetical protein